MKSKSVIALFGSRNEINLTLLSQLRSYVECDFISDFEFHLPPILDYRFIFINLMDINNSREEELLEVIEALPLKPVLIAIHVFMTQSLIDKTISKGYTHYLPLFSFKDEFPLLIDEFHALDRIGSKP